MEGSISYHKHLLGEVEENFPTSTKRQKWTSHQINLKVENLVITSEDKIGSSKWPLARIIDTHVGKDRIKTSVKLKTSTSELIKPVAKLCLLEEGSSYIINFT